jgi:membrane associated rhomboid family serine protease
MVPADVGYHCPECVSTAAAASRQPVTMFGGRFGKEGAVTTVLIGICAGAFVLVSVLDLFGGNGRWAMQPVAIALGDQWARLFTAMFLHAGLLHIAFNMYALYLLGPALERALGHGRFLTLYLVSGLGGSVASYLFSPIMTSSVGASGAIFGLMAAWVVVHSRLKTDYTPVLILLGINVVLGFLMPGIDWRAHLGGAVVGALVTLVLTTGRGPVGRAQLGRQAAMVAGIVVVLLGLVVWRTDQIQSLVAASFG